MDGLGIGDITHGYSKSGAQQYLTDLNTKAITETIEILNDVNALKAVFQAGWQGQAEVNFEKNLDTAIKHTSEALESLRTTLNTEIENINTSIDNFDNDLIVEE